MKKILLVGKLADTVRTLSERLMEEYNVLLGTMQLDNVKGMLKIVKPDMIALYLENLNKEELELAQWIMDETKEIPVLVLAVKELEEKCNKLFAGDRYTIQYPPFVITNICKRCTELLGQEDLAHAKMLLETSEAKKVLVIDDNASELRNMKAMLEEYYEIILATSGEMGVQRAIEKKPDIILLDYEMPRVNGTATFAMLQETVTTKNIPVIFLTGVSDVKRVREVLELHPAGYILKPAEKKKLIAQIESVFEKNK